MRSIIRNVRFPRFDSSAQIQSWNNRLVGSRSIWKKRKEDREGRTARVILGIEINKCVKNQGGGEERGGE